jgi:hypothetical protein
MPPRASAVVVLALSTHLFGLSRPIPGKTVGKGIQHRENADYPKKHYQAWNNKTHPWKITRTGQ